MGVICAKVGCLHKATRGHPMTPQEELTFWREMEEREIGEKQS